MYIDRLIRVFSNSDDSLVAEIKLKSFSLPDFQVMFGIASDNPMFDCYQIEPRQIDFVLNYVQEAIEWDFEKYSYFLEADACC